MTEPRPLQAVADVLDLYVELCRTRVPEVPTVDAWCEGLDAGWAALVQQVGTNPLELASLLHTAAAGHIEAAALCLRTESADTAFAVLTLFRTVLEASARAWWLCEPERDSRESLRRLAVVSRAVHQAEVRRGNRQKDGERQRQAQASAQAVVDRASLLGIGGLGMPNRTDQAAALLNGDESAYDFLSGLTHADPVEIHHLIKFASDRDGAGWSRGVAAVSAVMLLEPLRAHGRAFLRFLEVSSADNYPGTERDVQRVLGAVATAVNHAAPPHW